jgi:hypothetical protein
LKSVLPLLVLRSLGPRALIIVLGGNDVRFRWSVGDDMPLYVLLAKNLLANEGFTYAGLPTAMRPPVCSMLVAGEMWLFGSKYARAVRWLQFGAVLVTVILPADGSSSVRSRGR